MTIDEFDAKILNELQINSDLTAEVIGQRVGLSGSAVTKRLKRLNSSGLIECHVAVLNQRLIGPFVQALVICSFDPDGPIVKEEFSDLARSRPEVTNVWILTGEVDIAMAILTRTLDECAQTLRALQEEFPQLKNMTEHIVTAQPKRSLAVPFTLAGLKLRRAG